MLTTLVLQAFADELEKMAVSKSQLSVPQSRSGRRPITVDNYLKKDKDGTLWKKKEAYTISDGRTGREIDPRARPGDVPSMEGSKVVGQGTPAKKEYAKENAVVVHGNYDMTQPMPEAALPY